MKTFNKIATGLSVLAATTGSAFAEVPTEVTTALDGAKADGVTIAGVVLTVIIAIAAFKYIRRAL